MMGSMPSTPILPARGGPVQETVDIPAAIRPRVRWELAAFAVVIAGVALRVLALADRSLTWDETYSIFIASQPVTRVLVLTAANEAHPPLYYLLLHWWVQVFGPGEAAARALSVPIGTAIVLVTWMFGRRLIGEAPALLAAALVALAPSQVATAQEARMYGLLALTALSSWWALWAGMTGGRRASWVAYAVISAVMLYSHYYGFFVLASHFAFLLWRRAPGDVWRRWTYATIGALALFMPWLPALPMQFGTGRAWPVYRPPLTPALYIDTLTSITMGQLFFDAIHGGSIPRELSWSLTVGAVVVVVIGYRALRRAPAERALMVASVFFPLTLAYGVSLVVNIFAPRYLTFLMPGLALLAGAGVAAIGTVRTRWARACAVAALAVLIVPNVASLVRYYQFPKLDYFDWRQVSHTLAAQAHDDDAIVFLPGFARIAVNYYYPAPASQPRLVLTPYGQDVLGPKNERLPEVVASLVSRPRVWIISVIPVPPSVDAMMAALGRQSFAVTRREEVNVMRLFLLERKAAP